MKNNIKNALSCLIKRALDEDVPFGDISTMAVVPKDLNAKGAVVSKGEYVVSGIDIAKKIYSAVDKKIEFKSRYKNGEIIKNGKILFHVYGAVHSLLKAERTALNVVSHMMGVATKTKHFVNMVKGAKTVILDTRKTLPGLRALQKRAVTDGGGKNHRFSLSDAVLLKENHIAAVGGIKSALKKVKKLKQKKVKIEIEVRNIKELKLALSASIKPDIIMLDNMSVKNTRQAVKLVKGRVKLESSGGINEKNIKQYAGTGVDFISLGSITHSAPSADLSFVLDAVGKK
ncbi:MAG: carboxylating nicotinate-nucleotide diphosphorylase [Pseudomonadota bacterium]